MGPVLRSHRAQTNEAGANRFYSESTEGYLRGEPLGSQDQS